MKIKSLLLGSAAAMVAVSAANAADIVIPEPEMVEYVRVCDAAGDGYFYIPGGEICLKISGEVVYEFNFSDSDVLGTRDQNTGVFTVTDPDGQQGWEAEYEISLDFETWRDTEYGELTTSIQLGADDDNVSQTEDLLGDANVQVNEAFMTLAGLTVGYTDSFYAVGFGASDLDADGPDTGLVAYTTDFGGGSFTLSIEDDGNADWMPAIVAAAEFTFDPVTVFGAVVYDDTTNFFGGAVTAEYTSGPITIDAGVQYSGDSDPATVANTIVLPTAYSTGYEWVFGIGAEFEATEKLTLSAGFDYGVNQYATVITAADNSGTDDDWIIEVGADFEVTDGFTIGVEADFDEGGWDDAEMSFTVSF